MRNKNAPNKNQTTATNASNCKPKTMYNLLICSYFIITYLDFLFITDAYFINLVNVKALEKGTVLSMASVKVLCHNLFLMQRFISVLGIKPNQEINRRLWEEGVKFAAIAA